MMVDVYTERPKVFNFLRSFFPTVEETTKYLSIAVRRGSEMVAVDVTRGSEGNRNSFGKSTEKVIEPPYYREYFDATELDIYDRMFGDVSEISEATFITFMQDVSEKLLMLVDKIERAYELQCAQVLETGIVTVADGTNINFLRKAGSLVDNTGTAWTGANSPYTHFEAAGNFLRQVGKAQGGTLNAILGSTALNAFLDNSVVKARNDIKNMKLDDVRAPQRDSLGATLHGQISAGSYLVNLWAYPEFYDNASGVSTPYINPKKVIVLPEVPKFKLGFAAVPQLLKAESPRIIKGAYVFGDYPDERLHAHIFDVRSAGVAIPTAVDQIYTMQVVS